MAVEFIKVTPGKTRRVKIKADTRVAGQHLSIGRVVELVEEDAHQLVVAGKAEFLPEKAG